MTKPPRGFVPRRERGSDVRMKHTKVKTAKGRKLSSKMWLERQLNDPFVVEANRRGYRSRAAFKLTGIDDKYKFLKSGARVVDLGAAPGGWAQVAAAIVLKGKHGHQGKVVALDIQAMEPLPDVTMLIQDFMDDDAPDNLKAALGSNADIVMSDMAAAATGHTDTDHMRIMGLCEAALEFAREVLNPGGVFLAKVLKGGTEGDLLNSMKRDFTTVRHAKPPASRQDSAEAYVIALGFKGRRVEGQDEDAKKAED